MLIFKENVFYGGTVLATSTTISYPDGVTLNDQIKATIVVISGDSGAAIVSGSSLVGFLSGHDANSYSYYTKESNVRSNIPGLAWKFSYPP